MKKRYNDKNPPTAEEMTRYMRNEMTEEESYAFERKLQSSSFYREAEEGFSDLTSDIVEQDIKNLRKRLLKKNQKNKYTWATPVAVAAGIAVVFVISWLLINWLEVPKKVLSTEISKIEKNEAVESQNPQEAADDQDLLTYEEEDEENGSPVSKIQERRQDIQREQQDQSLSAEEATVPDISELEEVELLSDKEIKEAEINADRSLENKIEARSEIAREEVISPEENTEEPVKQRRAGVSGVVSPAMAAETPLPPVQLPVATEISGRVISGEDMQPLPGVSAILKGTSMGTVTDIEGKFTLPVPDSIEKVLVFSFIGFESTEFEVSDSAFLEVALNADMAQLSEVIVTGYGADRITSIITQAQPEGGFSKFRKYLKNNIYYPAGYQGKKVVKIYFTITPNGDISNIEIKDSPGREFEEELKRSLLEGPEWQPATVNGFPQEERITMKIRFRSP